MRGLFKGIVLLILGCILLLSVVFISQLTRIPGMSPLVFVFGLRYPWIWTVFQILLLVLCGFLFICLVAVLSQKNGKKRIRREKEVGDIVFPKRALESIVATTVENKPFLTPKKIQVTISKKNQLRIYVTVSIAEEKSFEQVGEQIQEEIVQAFEQIANLQVEKIALRFETELLYGNNANKSRRQVI